MSNSLYEKAIDYKTLKESYKRTQQAQRKYRKEAIVFDMAREKNLVKLWRELKEEKYTPSDYIEFKVYEPKERLIHAPRIRDKIVQFAAHVVLQEVYYNRFIDSSYACLVERGTHKAVDKVQHNMRHCKWKYGEAWVVKMDVAKFFYSINRDILKQILRKKIKDDKFLNLLDKIIDSSPEGEKGIPLGNVTSQDFANIYMNEVDQYAKRFLGLKYYVRYMDDIIIVVPTKGEAQKAKEAITAFLNDRLDLQINDKTKIFPIEQGVNAYGFKIYTTHRLVRNSSKAAMKRRIKAMDRKVKNGELTEEYVQQCVNSWLGHARHSNSFNLSKKLFSKYNYIRVENENFIFGQKSTHS
ncbi:MAG: reverse transcriptase/maturase family protein [Clostridium sp.]|nr:reverse transcriptase/maturase family protein [Clostridium sp.]